MQLQVRNAGPENECQKLSGQNSELLRQRYKGEAASHEAPQKPVNTTRLTDQPISLENIRQAIHSTLSEQHHRLQKPSLGPRRLPCVLRDDHLTCVAIIIDNVTDSPSTIQLKTKQAALLLRELLQ